MFRSQTYGKLNMDQIAEKILEFHNRTKTFDGELQVTVGTDSQNFDKTKVVSVIVAYKEGHGGIFFYEVTMIPRISDVARKLNEETSRSLSVIMDLAEKLEGEKYQGLRENTVLSVHIDAGWSEKGKTKELIPGLVGWIRTCGYDCRVKPDSYAASSIADRISK